MLNVQVVTSFLFINKYGYFNGKHTTEMVLVYGSMQYYECKHSLRVVFSRCLNTNVLSVKFVCVRDRRREKDV